MTVCALIFLVMCMSAICNGHSSYHNKLHVQDQEHVKVHNASYNNLHVQDKEHAKGHFQGFVNLDKLSEEQLKFHYFTSHDVEGNGKLDGCELVQSLLHFHSEESSVYGYEPRPIPDEELSLMVDHVLKTDDKNFDGFIDFSEFVAGQIGREF